MHAILKSLLVTEYHPVAPDPADDQLVQRLRDHVEALDFHRSYQTPGNIEAQEYIFAAVRKHCDFVRIIDRAGNIEAGWGDPDAPVEILIGAHYDSPPGSPGADDNSSAVAVAIETLAALNRLPSKKNVRVVFFNGEEYGMIGSRQYADRFGGKVGGVIVLEMVGYYSDQPGSQQAPDPFPKFDVGDFLAIVSNSNSTKLSDAVLAAAKTIDAGLPLKRLSIPFGLERLAPSIQDVLRSDHAPFWSHGIPALMLTDTANFRNQNYHQITDTPETLDYEKMAELVRILTETGK